jgi:hypothetical protein
MSLKINSNIATNAGTGKRIQMQYVALACGAALAVGAAVGFGSWENGGNDATSVPAPTASSAPRYSYETELQRLTFYLAGSPEQVAQMEATENHAALERIYANIVDPASTTVILLADTPENEALARSKIQAVAMDGAVGNFTLDVIDLRVN